MVHAHVPLSTASSADGPAARAVTNWADVGGRAMTFGFFLFLAKIIEACRLKSMDVSHGIN